MRRLWLGCEAGFAVVLALGLAGCNPAASVHPLYIEGEQPASDARIEGEWVSPNLQASTAESEVARRWKLRFVDGHYLAEMHEGGESSSAGSQEEKTEQYQLTLVQLDGKTFVDAVLTGRKTPSANIQWDDKQLGILRTHLVGRIWVSTDYLRVGLLGGDWVRKNVPEELRVADGATSVVLTSSADLRKLFAQHAEDDAVFAEPLYFCRPKMDCLRHVADDELARKPNDPETIKQAAGIYFKRQKYDKAVELDRHLVAVQPADASAREMLALGLAFTRDFNGARAELAEAAKLDDENRDMLLGFSGWSYFVEGDYEQAEKALAANNSATAILLRYYSLQRLGQRKQAEAMLAKQAAGFKGSVQDQLLLLDAQGRLQGASSPSGSEEERTQYLYFDALHDIAMGDTKSAREKLEQSISAGDPLLSLPATMELERMQKAVP